MPFRLGPAVGVVVLCLSLAAPRVAGRQDQGPPVFRGGVNIVYVDAYPRRDGRLVEGLHAGDFQVLEDGKPQAIEAFEFIRVEPNTPDAERRDPNTKAEGDALAADPHHRVFVIYLDIYHTTFAGAHDANQPLLDFLGRTIGPTDLFGVVTPESPLPVSHLVFARRLDTLQAELTKYFNWGLQGQVQISIGRLPIEQQLETCIGLADMGGVPLIALQHEDTFMTNLEALMNYLRDLRDERKNLIFVSEGWTPTAPIPLTSLHTRDPETAAKPPGIGTGPNGRLGVGVAPAGTSDHVWCNEQAERLAAIDFQKRFRDVVGMAARANVTFYPVDPGGLRGSEGPATQSNGLRPVEVLQTLAENTGGLAIVRTNDVVTGFRRISDELSGYYLLGYASTNTASDGKYRRIEVKVGQSGVNVAARRGYLAPTPAARSAMTAPVTPGPSTAVSNELARLSHLRPDAELFSYGVKRPDGLDVVVEIGAAESSRWVTGANLRVNVAGSKGDTLTATGQIERGARAAIVQVPVSTQAAGPWTATVRVSRDDRVLDDQTVVGDPAPTALVGDPLVFRGTAAARIALRPVADFQFRRNERLHLEWPVWNPVDQRVARVLDRRGQPMALNVALTEPTPGVLAGDLLLAPLAEGDYLIELVAGAGARSEQRLSAFRVVR